MKRFFFLIFSLALFINAYSQKIAEGSLAPLKTSGKAKVVLDFDNASIHGMTVGDFAEYEQDWNIDKPEIEGKFKSALADKCDVIQFGNELDADITLHVKVLSINTKGNYSCECIVKSRQGEKIAIIEGVIARGGTFGSKLNLIKDGAEHTGIMLGKFLKRTLGKNKVI